MASKIWIGRIGRVTGKNFALNFELDQSTTIGRNPEHSWWILSYIPNDIPELLRFVGQVLKIAGIIMGKFPSISIEPVETTSIGSDPECPSRIFEEGPDPIMADAERIIWIVFVNGEAITIVLVKPIVSSKPHEALAVLKMQLTVL